MQYLMTGVTVVIVVYLMGFALGAIIKILGSDISDR